MIYPFVCDSCNEYEELIRPVSECSDPAICKCGETMRRVWTKVYVNHKSHTNYFNHGLGKEITSNRQLKEEIKKYNDINNTDIVEVGNEKVNTKPKKKSYEPTRHEMQEISAMLGE